MADDLDTRYRQLLAKQLTMNEETWRALQEHGVDESTNLRLDFSYNARDEASAKSLKTVLEEQTDYEVNIVSDGAMFRKKWSVSGSTQPTSVSKEIIDQWVDWMVTAGLHENCEFDGWGAQV
jgi:hypothetical protein